MSKLKAELQPEATMNATLTSTNNLGGQLAGINTLQSVLTTPAFFDTAQIRYNTVSGWNSQVHLISENRVLYVYTDYKTNSEGEYIPGFKVGDGTSYLIDKPFIDAIYENHINNTEIHITELEREFWNQKVRCYLGPNETVVFTTQ